MLSNNRHQILIALILLLAQTTKGSYGVVYEDYYEDEYRVNWERSLLSPEDHVPSEITAPAGCKYVGDYAQKDETAWTDAFHCPDYCGHGMHLTFAVQSECTEPGCEERTALRSRRCIVTGCNDDCEGEDCLCPRQLQYILTLCDSICAEDEEDSEPDGYGYTGNDDGDEEEEVDEGRGDYAESVDEEDEEDEDRGDSGDYAVSVEDEKEDEEDSGDDRNDKKKKKKKRKEDDDSGDDSEEKRKPAEDDDSGDDSREDDSGDDDPRSASRVHST